MGDSLHTTRLHHWVAQSPPVVWTFRQLRELAIGTLKQGPVPRHIAFIMDGNRRYAREHRIESVEGHNFGFEALARILEVCYKIGVEVITVYAFSIENFKRTKYEVDHLMAMAKTKLIQLSQHGALLNRYGAAVRVLGERSLVTPDVLEAIEKAEAMTAHNTKAVLNICFPYTSRQEITTAVQRTVESYSTPLAGSPKPSRRAFMESHIAHELRKQSLEEGEDHSKSTSSRTPSPSASHGDHHSDSSTTVNETHAPPKAFLDPEHITAEALDENMLTAGTPPLDLLIRTSGVQRLSDFMLWQCHEHTSIKFLECLWPDFDLWQFLPVLVEWQWQRKKLQEEQQKSQRRA